MKKSLKKFLVACAAVTTVTLACAASAFAADTYSSVGDIIKSFDGAKVSIDMSKVAVSGTPVTGQLTILILDKDAVETAVVAEKILYIDQGDSLANGLFQGMGLKLATGTTALPVGEYLVKIGGENVAESGIFKGTLKVTAGGEVEFTLGDVNDDEFIDTEDATMILRNFLSLVEFTPTQTLAADVNKDAFVDTEDATLVLRHFLGLISSFE